MTWLKTAAACAVALTLGACASVSSNFGNSGPDQKGQAYYLPKGLIQVTVSEFAGQFDVTVAGPIMVADTDYRLHADLRKAALSDNNALVGIDPATQLLTTAQVTSTGRAKDIVENIYRSASGYEGAWQGGYARVEIFSGLYNPDDMEKASADASAALTNYFVRTCGEDGQNPLDPSRFEDCAQYKMLGIDQPGMVQISSDGPLGASTANNSIGKCGRGLCYRPLVPVKIRTVIAGTYTSEDYYMVPDTTSVSYFTLPSGMFATQEYALTFDLGVLIESDQKQQSEVAGFASLPADILERILSAPVKAIRGKPKPQPQPAYGGGYNDGRAGFAGEGPQPGEPRSYFRSKTISLGRSAAPLESSFRNQFNDPGQPNPGPYPNGSNEEYRGSSYFEGGQPVRIERVIRPANQTPVWRAQTPQQPQQNAPKGP